jgi:hypothetical protein
MLEMLRTHISQALGQDLTPILLESGLQRINDELMSSSLSCRDTLYLLLCPDHHPILRSQRTRRE